MRTELKSRQATSKQARHISRSYFAMTMPGSAADSFLRRHQVLQLSFWIQLLFAILYAMATMDVTGQCYSEPCSSGSPAITSGLGIATAIVAFVFISQVCML